MKHFLTCFSLMLHLLPTIAFTASLQHQTSKLSEPCRIGIEKVKISPDGNLLAVVCNDDYRNLTAEYSLAIYDLKGLKELTRIPFHEESVFVAPVFFPEFSRDSRELLIFTDRDRSIGLTKISLDPPYDSEYTPLSFENDVLKGVVTANHIAEDGQVYFGLGRYGAGPSLYSLDPKDFTVERIFTDKPSSTRGESVKAISTTGQYVLSMARDNYLRVHERKAPNFGQKTLLESASFPYNLANKDDVLYLGASQNLSEHDVASGKELSFESFDSEGPNLLIPRPDANLFLVLGGESSVQLRSLDKKELLLDTSNLAEYAGLYLPYVPVIDLSEEGSVLVVKTRDNLLVTYLN